MSGIAKYNNKSWNVHHRINSYPVGEDFELTIYHNNKKYEQVMYVGHSAVRLKNVKVVSHLAWSAWTNKNGGNYELEFDYTAPAHGEYTIESLMCCTGNATGSVKFNIDGINHSHQISLDDDRNNRIVHRFNTVKGKHTIKLIVPQKFMVLGIIVKKIDKYVADSFLQRESKLTMTSAKISTSDKTSPSSLTCTLLYDNDYKDVKSLTGFIFDFRDEINLSIRDVDGKMTQIFGGYISSASLDKDQTKLTINGASRLIDGDNHCSFEAMTVGGNVKDMDEYDKGDIQHFNSYAKAVKYLFDSYEVPLKNSISSDYIGGETYATGFEIKLGTTNGVGKQITGSNVDITKTGTNIDVRNKPTPNVVQSITLYDSNWYNSKPVELSEYPIFFIKYSMGKPLTTRKSNTTSSSGSAPSSAGTITVTGKESCGCGSSQYGYKTYTTTFKNYCPNCGRSGTLHFNPKGTYEGELTCGDGKAPWTDGCDSDFCVVCGGDKAGHGKCRRVKLSRVSNPQAGGSASYGSDSSDSTTSEVTITEGYDIDKPFQAYLVFEFSLTPDKNAKRYMAYLDFTADAPDKYTYGYSGLVAYPLNDLTQVSSVDLIEKIYNSTFSSVWNYPDKQNFRLYLRSIKLQYKTLKKLFENTDSNQDNSSYKMMINSVGFRKGTVLNPTNLDAVGDTINSTLEKLLESALYNLEVVPSEHRENDKAVLTMNTQVTPKYSVKEGDDGNIIDISDRNFNPVNDYHNHSVYTYVEKEEVLNGEDVEEKQHYRFVESRYPADVLRYGEITTAQTSSDGISSAEAYNRTKLNEKYGDNTKDSLTVTVIGYPSILNIDDNVECILEDDYYNDIKAVKSIEVEYDVANAPKIQTTLGLNKISPTLQLKKSFEKERAKTKNKDIIMKQTALFDVNETFYWEE